MHQCWTRCITTTSRRDRDDDGDDDHVISHVISHVYPGRYQHLTSAVIAVTTGCGFDVIAPPSFPISYTFPRLLPSVFFCTFHFDLCTYLALLLHIISPL